MSPKPSISPVTCRQKRLRRLTGGVAVAAALGLPGDIAAQQPTAPADTTAPIAGRDTTTGARVPGIAFAGVTVVDVRSGQLRPGQTIVVVGDRIQAVGDSSRVRVPAGARLVNATGSYAIPGLWDMHVHPFGLFDTFYPLFLANGVTGVREMSTPFLDSTLLWRRAIARGAKIGPRVVTSGPFLTTPEIARRLNQQLERETRGVPIAVGVGTPDEARRVVDSLQRAGVDFIKIRDGLARDVFFAIAAEARRVGLPLAGHLNDSITVVEASDSGQRSIEHGLIPGGVASRHCHLVNPPGVITLFESVGPDCPALAARFRRNGTWFSPASPDLGACWLSRDCSVVTRYWPLWLLTPFGGRPVYDAHAEWVKEQASVEHWSAAEKGLFGQMQRAGIRFLAGTDVSPSMFIGSHTVPGFSLHNVLVSLVRDGLTPLEALQSATLNPAEYLNATDSLGSIAPGQKADLVLLEANPLVDIYNTRRIWAVVANGRFFDRGDLDILLAEAEQVAQRARQP